MLQLTIPFYSAKVYNQLLILTVLSCGAEKGERGRLTETTVKFPHGFGRKRAGRAVDLINFLFRNQLLIIERKKPCEMIYMFYPNRNRLNMQERRFIDYIRSHAELFEEIPV